MQIQVKAVQTQLHCKTIDVPLLIRLTVPKTYLFLFSLSHVFLSSSHILHRTLSSGGSVLHLNRLLLLVAVLLFLVPPGSDDSPGDQADSCYDKERHNGPANEVTHTLLISYIQPGDNGRCNIPSPAIVLRKIGRGRGTKMRQSDEGPDQYVVGHVGENAWMYGAWWILGCVRCGLPLVSGVGRQRMVGQYGLLR